METDTDDQGRQALGILELIDVLKSAQWLKTSVCREQNIECLLEDLEDVYRAAMEPWAVHLINPEKLTQEDFYRWHEYMFKPDVFGEVSVRFNELMTTSRFSVNDVPCVHELEQVNSPTDEVTTSHIVSLAVFACIQLALEALESIEFIDIQSGDEDIKHQINEARTTQKYADLWLSHLGTLNLDKRNFDYELYLEKSRKSAKARKSAQHLRTSLTAETVAEYFKANPDNQQKKLVANLSEIHAVSQRTVSERLKEAKNRNLMQ